MKPGLAASLSLWVVATTTTAAVLAQPQVPPPPTAAPTVSGSAAPPAASTAPAPEPPAAPPTEPQPSAAASSEPSAAAEPVAPAPSPLPPRAPEAAPAPAATPTPSATPEPARWTWAREAPATPDDRGTAAEEGGQPARVPWKGTGFVSSHALTTTAVGVGADYQSSSYQSYSQGYSLLLNYFLYDNEGSSLRVAVSPGFDVELTNSDDTDLENELVFQDLPLTVAAGTPLYAEEGSLYRTALGLNFTTFVATSKYTRGSGDIATFSPRVSLAQSLPLLGKGSESFQSFQVGVGLRYDYLWSEADVEVADGVNDPSSNLSDPVAPTDDAAVSRIHTGRALQDGSGNTASSDVLSGARQTPNSVRATAFVAFSEELGIPMELALGVTYGEAYLADTAAGSVEIATGPVELAADSGRTERRTAGVSAGFTLFPTSELGITLGYENGADLDGPSPNLFYTPRALFTGALVIGLDALYERATGKARSEPFML